jgi:hypothetical protein
MTRRDAIAKLEQLARDPNRDHIEEKFRQCPDARIASELLGAAVLGRKGYSRHIRREDSLPVPVGLVNPG